MKKSRNILTIALALCMLLSLGAFASGEASGDDGGAAPRASSGTVVLTVQDGEVALDGTNASIARPTGAQISVNNIGGIQISSQQNGVGAVAYYGEDDLLIGGEDDIFTVDSYYTGEELAFNTVIDLDETGDYDWSSTSSGGFGITAAGSGLLTIDNVYVKTAGIGRYSLDTSNGDIVVKDSLFESLGCRAEYCDMPWFTFQFGASRNIIMTSTSNVYVYNSECLSDGYASWSTDMTSGTMYLYNADCVNYYGGYGTYADGCTVYVYGSDFDSAEYGMFDTNGGRLYVGSSADALSASDELFLENLQGEELTEDTPSVIRGDRNAVAMHVVATSSGTDPDHNGIVDTNTSSMYNTQPKLYATNSTFTTLDAIGSTLAEFPETVEMYLDHMHGSTIAFRSCNADVRLENCVLGSSNGILFQSVIDLDGSAVQILDDIATEDISGICIKSVGNDWTGDISHEDYQRPMRLTFEDTTFTGAMLAGTMEDWLALWEPYADLSYSVSGETGLYVNDADPDDTAENFRIQDPDEIYQWAVGVTEYDAVRGIYLTMDADSVWNVTAESQLVSLTLDAGAVVNGIVTVDGETVDTAVGGSWTGNIIVAPAS